VKSRIKLLARCEAMECLLKEKEASENSDTAEIDYLLHEIAVYRSVLAGPCTKADVKKLMQKNAELIKKTDSVFGKRVLLEVIFSLGRVHDER